MTVDVILDDPRWADLNLAVLAGAAADATLDRLGLEPSVWEISLLACDDARIAQLNQAFRGKAQPTNVLSWPSEERGAATPGEMPLIPGVGPDPELGDIALAFETCAREAAAAQRALSDHATHLLVHGTLHLLGFDHENDADAALMEGLEVEILATLGVADPYSEYPTRAD